MRIETIIKAFKEDPDKTRADWELDIEGEKFKMSAYKVGAPHNLIRIDIRSISNPGPEFVKEHSGNPEKA